MGDIGLAEKRIPSKPQRFRSVLLTSRKGRRAGLRPTERPFHKERQLPTGFHIEPKKVAAARTWDPVRQDDMVESKCLLVADAGQ